MTTQPIKPLSEDDIMPYMFGNCIEDSTKGDMILVYRLRELFAELIKKDFHGHVRIIEIKELFAPLLTKEEKKNDKLITELRGKE